MKVNKTTAKAVLVAEASAANNDDDDRSWDAAVERLSQLCEGASKTHIAFVGTAILAKATAVDVDAFSVKAGAGTHGSYSARGLAHGVLVPTAPSLGINLGVSGPEPLNNQPYFRIARATADEILPLVRDPAPVYELIRILDRLEGVRSTAQAREALRAYIRVRRKYEPIYAAFRTDHHIRLHDLIRKIIAFVNENSEGGKRAQAVAAGLMDMAMGPDLVHTGRVNDPDRNLPGDVGVRTRDGTAWERTFEVRDKPVNESDLFLFARKCAREGMRKAAVLAVSAGQQPLKIQDATSWAVERDVSLTVFVDWTEFVRQAVFWSQLSEDVACEQALRRIHQRLIEIESSPQAVASWVEAD